MSPDQSTGSRFGFLGPNGAGKTTTMRLITQALEPDSGTIEIDGQVIDRDSEEVRRRIGYLPETNPLYQEMLVGEGDGSASGRLPTRRDVGAAW